MPRFSIIVPSHGVAGRLSQALDSVLAQSHGDLELIPVCDGPGSPGDDIAARYAATDTRVTPVHSPPEDGLGAARNAGVRAAGGTYLLFLDGDDLLLPGALGALDARLAATGDVDVVHAPYERAHWWDGESVVTTAHLPAKIPKDAFSPARAPELTGVTVPAWSAAYRRDFVMGNELAFPEGHFTDVGWGGLVTVAAERVTVADTALVRHRARRQGSALNLPGEHHFQLLDQTELVLLAATERGLSGSRFAALFGRLFASVLRLAAQPERLPARRRRAFFRRAGRLYRAHRPAGYRPPGGSVGVQHRLLAAGAYSAFRALRGANRTAGRLTGAGPARTGPSRPGPSRALPGRLRGLRTRRRYARRLRRPMDPNLAVFCAYWGRGYACSPAAIHAKARQLAPHIRSVFLVEADAAASMPPDVEHAVIGSRDAWDLLARARYLVNNANFAEDVVKRPGSVHVQTQHGTPLKKMGVDQSTYPVVAAATGSFTKLLGRVDRWDYNLSSNRHSTQMWERAFPGSYEALEYGYPRNDVFYTSRGDDVARVRRELGVPEGSTAVLYAPTHRDHHTGFETGLDLEAFCEAAGENVVVLLRAHYFYDRGGRSTSGRIIDVTSHRSSEDVCLAADALVTDYSSIMFDYANLDRPIVVHADDWDVYRETRGVYFDLTLTPPGPVTRTPGELARVFADGSYRGPASTAARARFRERFCQFDDGQAAERVVRRVLLGEPPEAVPPVIPLAERVPAPAAATLVRS